MYWPSALERVIVSFVTLWMHLEDIVLREKSP
jgi:hypothetical protein